MRRGLVLGFLMAAGTLSMVVVAAQQKPPAPKPIEMQKIRDNMYVLLSNIAGSPEFTGGASTVFVTDAGVVVVDTKNAGQGPIMLEKIRSVTDKPVTMIINTHTHGDHTGNNTFFGATVESVVHENTKTAMEKMPAFQGDNAKFLPKRTFKDKLSVTSGKERIDLYYFGPAHTNGDAVVVFPSQRVASTGDLFSGKNPPRIDPGNGGTGVGYSPTALKMLAGLTNIESFVTGHGAVMTQQDAQEWGRFQQDFAGTIQAAFKKGLSVDDAAASVVAALSGKYSAYGLEGAFKARVTEDVGIFYKEMQR